MGGVLALLAMFEIYWELFPSLKLASCNCSGIPGNAQIRRKYISFCLLIPRFADPIMLTSSVDLGERPIAHSRTRATGPNFIKEADHAPPLARNCQLFSLPSELYPAQGNDVVSYRRKPPCPSTRYPSAHGVREGEKTIAISVSKKMGFIFAAECINECGKRPCVVNSISVSLFTL